MQNRILETKVERAVRIFGMNDIALRTSGRAGTHNQYVKNGRNNRLRRAEAQVFAAQSDKAGTQAETSSERCARRLKTLAAWDKCKSKKSRDAFKGSLPHERARQELERWVEARKAML